MIVERTATTAYLIPHDRSVGSILNRIPAITHKMIPAHDGPAETKSIDISIDMSNYEHIRVLITVKYEQTPNNLEHLT